jgi:transcription antitermination factor NusG
MAKWCNLRTSGARTLPLARSLTSAGFEVWTPTEEHEKRRPRSKIKIGYEAPIMPTFVFAREEHIPDLARCLTFEVSQHPPFSIFHYCGRIPVIEDRDIASLRGAEDRARTVARKKAKPREFHVGSQVRMEDGAYAGMSGVVKSSEGRFVLVDLGGTFVVKIAAFLLSADLLQDGNAHLGTAAQAA